VEPGGRPHGHDVRIETSHLREHVVAASAYESARVPRTLEASGDIERSERLGTLDLLHDEQNPRAHGDLPANAAIVPGRCSVRQRARDACAAPLSARTVNG